MKVINFKLYTTGILRERERERPTCFLGSGKSSNLQKMAQFLSKIRLFAISQKGALSK